MTFFKPILGGPTTDDNADNLSRFYIHTIDGQKCLQLTCMFTSPHPSDSHRAITKI